MTECEICGRNTDDLYEIKVEGALMLVCEKCSKGKLFKLPSSELLLNLIIFLMGWFIFLSSLRFAWRELAI